MKIKFKKQLNEAITDSVIHETLNREYARSTSLEELQYDIWDEVLKENVAKAFDYYFDYYTQECPEEVPDVFQPVMPVIESGFEKAALGMAQQTIEDMIGRTANYCRKLATMDDQEFSAFLDEKIAQRKSMVATINSLVDEKYQSNPNDEVNSVIEKHVNNRSEIAEKGLDNIIAAMIAKKNSKENVASYQKEYLRLMQEKYSFCDEERGTISYSFAKIYQAFDNEVSDAVGNAILDENEYNDEVESRVSYFIALRDMDEDAFSSYLDQVIADLEAEYKTRSKIQKRLWFTKKK